jgi:hypothetical protein
LCFSVSFLCCLIFSSRPLGEASRDIKSRVFDWMTLWFYEP